ncbi:hypothetical protein FE407_01980 [Leuconostoc carnosum]|uniref:Uncharacterized protein n=2 Tax=Leuconostoc carnosum TaxID=1252 RepID=K0DBL7_LEUCJ|nr:MULTISPECIES: hypothetical protein [Leuconostoc]AFT81316.1 hypothetical protein C270_02005 [Leuconostoc carnosum JB16]KAA8330135.1 hypothetical protein FE409_02020 [Leuconostoc carnosum]KAA8362209.1 hypothetical protein FE407_01980 [Leuconostoc carnosum]KAA8366758.1 hypothetical protein FE406_01980 [Leuconostoc carnosum]KAA8367872.1 hypothetical protein FE416_02120 [Leuconostoc carnosum]
MISNKKDIKNFATTALRIAVYSTLPGSVSLITKKTQDSEGNIVEVNKTNDELDEDLTKVEFWSEMTKKKAQVAQEMAIANRISTAETVEIEEFFDKNAEGNLGVDYSKGANIGGKGQNVSKRIYRFTGFNDNTDGVSEILKSVMGLGDSNEQEIK